MAIIKVIPVKNTTKSGGRSSRAAMIAAEYYTHRRQMEQQHRQWYGPNGPEAYTDVREWIKAQSHAHTYTMKLVLSVGEGVDLTPADWRAIMQQQTWFTDWRLVEHDNTNNDHAHVIAFADKQLRRGEFQTWQRETRGLIKERELVYERQMQMQRQPQHQVAPEQIGEQTLAHKWEWEMEPGSEIQQEHQQQHQISRGMSWD